MIRLDTWWATVGEETTYDWNFEVINAVDGSTVLFNLYPFEYGQYASDPYGTTLTGGAGAEVIATVTAGDAAGNTDTCSFLMMLWPEGSELRMLEKCMLFFEVCLPRFARRYENGRAAVAELE